MMLKLAPRLLAAIAIAAPLAACETTSSRETGFDRAAFAWSQERGRGRIDGRLAYNARGRTYSCQAAGVVLTPETPWVRQRMQRLYRSTERAVAPVAAVRQRTPGQTPEYGAMVKRAACDANGRFSFSGLPDGAWYIITSGQPNPAGAQLAFMRRVVIRGGETVRIDI